MLEGPDTGGDYEAEDDDLFEKWVGDIGPGGDAIFSFWIVSTSRMCYLGLKGILGNPGSHNTFS